jgi:hypothetical protein
MVEGRSVQAEVVKRLSLLGAYCAADEIREIREHFLI